MCSSILSEENNAHALILKFFTAKKVAKQHLSLQWVVAVVSRITANKSP